MPIGRRAVRALKCKQVNSYLSVENIVYKEKLEPIHWWIYVCIELNLYFSLNS